MFQFPRFASAAYGFSGGYASITSRGFPHSGIRGSRPACGSPRLIAACHALHRFLAPRHPPSALSSLTTAFVVSRTLEDALASRGSRMRLSKSHAGRAERPAQPAPYLVEMSGFEPPPSCLQGRRSPTELHPPAVVGLGRVELPTSRLSGARSNHLSYRPPKGKCHWLDRWVTDLGDLAGRRPEDRRPADLLRKEVIQPQVPLRLPCYDFTPITDHTFGACPPCGLAQRLLVQPAFVV